MPTIITKGDILHSDGIHTFAHGVDVKGAMSAGLSLAFKKRWPAMSDDFQRVAADKAPQLGDLVVWSDGTDTVYSLVIQEALDKKAKMTAFERAMRSLIARAIADERLEIAMGRVGAGPAGLDWTRVKKMLSELTDGSPVSLLIFDQFVRAKT